MTKYKPKAVWNEELGCEIEVPPVTIFERDDGIPTGLLDKHGRELYRYERGPLGFIK